MTSFSLKIILIFVIIIKKKGSDYEKLLFVKQLRGGGVLEPLASGLRLEMYKNICYYSDDVHSLKRVFNMKNIGFTLAEVLITLGILGVVAALTMPALIGNYKKQQSIQQVKKIYSVLGQAFNHAVADYGDSSEWDTITPATASSYFDTYWKPYLQAPVRCYSYKECGYENYTPFFKSNKNKDDYVIHPDAGTINSRVMIHLNDGTFIMIITSSGYGRDDRRILVDLNGAKLPNRFGNDVFFFLRVNGKGIVPFGYDKSVDEVNKDCSSTGDGYMCAAKLMRAGWTMEKDFPF